MNTHLENLAINTIRTLAMDAVQAAKSGHPGTPMSLAPVAYVLFNERMKYDPNMPTWQARDRFILSCGHASTLLYSLIHLSEIKQYENGQPTGELAVPLDHLKQFRQLGSRCPGHPEYGVTSGVEMTTGPLGAGVATSVGIAISGNWMAGTYNCEGEDLFGFNVYALCGDGDMMEGVTAEAASLAGHLKLANLCWIYDDNKITIEGSTDLAFTEDVAARFRAYGWNVVCVDDVNDLEALRDAFNQFESETSRPTLIKVKSVIGYGSPNKAGSHEVHGAPLGEDEIRLTKRALGWPEDEKFYVPEEVRDLFRAGIGIRGPALREAWDEKIAAYYQHCPKESAEIGQILRGELPADWDAKIEKWAADSKGTASRNSSGKVLNQLAQGLPWMLGGSADLAPSNKSALTFSGAGDYSPQTPEGRNFHFGIREHAMASVANGMALSGLRSFCATFFVFCDYLRPAMRLSALMKLPVLYIFTHDSIGVGEDGPTHQPVEQLAALRAIPGLIVMRPADANEVACAYRVYAEGKKPMALILTRQDLPTLDRTQYACSCGVRNGGYILKDAPSGEPEVILIGTGSEVGICLDAQKTLQAQGVETRVVSMPSWELFNAQSQEYREMVLPPACKRRVAVEAALDFGWARYLGLEGKFVGMHGFGDSAPYKKLYEHFGITVEKVVESALETGK